MRITDSLLRECGACADQRKLFRKLYPGGANTTAATLRRAAMAGLSISWLERFIPAPAWKAYKEATAPAWKAYKEAIFPAQKAFLEAIFPARKAYDEALARARKACNEAIAPAWKAYEEAIAPARKAYREATALALAKALRGVR